ncbi:MAG: tyrosine-type recombinase/integrase [Planctomycetota bacterium]
MARSRFGTVREIPHRENWWCVFRKGIGRKPDGSRKYRFITRFGGRTKLAGERLCSRVWVLLQDAWELDSAIAHVWDEPIPGTSRTTFASLIELYFKDIEAEGLKKKRTIKGDKYRAAVLENAPWASLDIGSFGKPELRAWVNVRLKDGTAGGTVNNDLSLASAIIHHAKDRGWVEDDDWDPFSRCRIAHVRRKETIALEIAEYNHLMNAIQRVCPDAYPIFLAAGQSGWRAGDLTDLTWGDIHWPKLGPVYMEVRSADEKIGMSKRAYLTPQLREVLGGDSKIRHLPHSLVFHRKRRKPWDAQSLGRRLRKALASCTNEEIPAAKKELMTFHSLRHTARSILRDLGFDAFAISAQVGHKTVDMAAHYTHTRPEELERMAEAVGRATGPKDANAARAKTS